MSRLTAVMQRMEVSGAWELETNAKLSSPSWGFKISTPVSVVYPAATASVLLWQLPLLSEPDVLLMDEPTNHLDALSVEWLQSYLNRYRGAILLITHDRYFLIASPTVLSKLTGDIYTYAGNYSYYLEKKL